VGHRRSVLYGKGIGKSFYLRIEEEWEMANAKVRVGINGYGVIGKRVADAVALPDDMELTGFPTSSTIIESGPPSNAEFECSLLQPRNSSEPVSIPHLAGPQVSHPSAAAVRAAHMARLCEGFKGAEEPEDWE
jgi:hypothetical protein